MGMIADKSPALAQILLMHREPSSRQRAKARLVAEIAAAERLARSGRGAEAEAILRALANDPDAALLGPGTTLGLPRKLHSALVRLAKIRGDAVQIVGLRATAVPPADLSNDLFAAPPGVRAAHVAAASWAVPKHIHQIWIGGPPPVACAAWAAFAARHGWAYRLWDDAALEELGISGDPLWQSMLRRGDLPGAVDVARYHLLLREGGLYLDCDWYPARADLPPEAVLPLRGLSALAEPSPRLVAGDGLLLSNALFAAPARHPALEHLIATLPAFADRLPDAPAWWVTGPLPFTLAARLGPVTVLASGLAADHLPRGTDLREVQSHAASCEATDAPGFLIAWKSW